MAYQDTKRAVSSTPSAIEHKHIVWCTIFTAVLIVFGLGVGFGLGVAVSNSLHASADTTARTELLNAALDFTSTATTLNEIMTGAVTAREDTAVTLTLDTTGEQAFFNLSDTTQIISITDLVSSTPRSSPTITDVTVGAHVRAVIPAISSSLTATTVYLIP